MGVTYFKINLIFFNLPLAFIEKIYYNTLWNLKSNFCHAACWSCATERCEPCQAGNRAALSGLPVRYSSPARRVTEVGLFLLLFRELYKLYRVLYRKWRPQTFSDVAGQPHITDTLMNEVRENRLAHAYLFTGSRGTGKTSCAKILSKAINCLSPVDGNPCNNCEICRGIDNGSVLDVVVGCICFLIAAIVFIFCIFFLLAHFFCFPFVIAYGRL